VLPDLEEVSVDVFSLLSYLPEHKLAILNIRALYSLPVFSKHLGQLLEMEQLYGNIN